jgi:ribosomal protein S18 acetylase RimI-like enzyme
MNNTEISIRFLEAADIPEIAQAFKVLGWHKPSSQYEAYLVEQTRNRRNVHVAFVDREFAGYVTVWYATHYAPFRDEGIPEISDFNVLPEFRRRGIGTQLMDKAEAEIAQVSALAGLGVGLTADYGAAQRMYARRGYIPDGRGLYARDHYAAHGETITVDDDLVLYLTKKMKA